MKKHIKVIKKSPILMEKLENLRIHENQKPICLINHFEIRWNSLYETIERFLELYPQIAKLVIEEKSNIKFVILFYL